MAYRGIAHHNLPSSIAAGPGARLPVSNISGPQPAKPATKHQTFYAIVQYDFVAERPDELDARAGEPISVVAQSNREWFVAKPIGRLGGPGLIPVSFVEIRDPLSNQPVRDVEGLMDRGVLPRVEEWKQATAEYKASSIPLGVLDVGEGSGVKDSPFAKANTTPTYPAPPQQYNPSRTHDSMGGDSLASTTRAAVDGHHPAPAPAPPVSDLLALGDLLAASIPSFHYENNEYWFRIDATYQTHPAPYPHPNSEHVVRTLQLILYRNYDDFYEFQIALLDAFPVEAGRVEATDEHGYPTPPASVEEGSTRILPFMPGPVSYVDDMITSVRRTELDQYLNELVELEARGAGHVLRHDLVRSFFSAKSGDVVDEVDSRVVPPPAWDPIAEEEDVDPDATFREAERGMENLRLKPQADHTRTRSSGGSGNYDPRVSNSTQSQYDRSSAAENGGRYSEYEDQGRDTPNGGGGPHKNYSEDSYGHAHSTSVSSAAGGSSTLHTPYSTSAESKSARSSSHEQRDSSSPAFLKIKIFHSESDDLIAIRVPPRVTFNQLIGKVRDRLGPGVSMLRYRDSFDGLGSKSWREIDGDEDLREWIQKGDKLVLYAD